MTSPAPPVARVLMVDDRLENLVALEAILQPLGHELVRATSGQEALRQVLLHDFAVILMDVQMPGMNGFETVQTIKSRERSRHTPIIFLTAISKDEDFVFEGYSTGAVDYLSKPFHPDVLRSKVAVFVDLYLKELRLRRQAEELRDAERRELELRHRAELVRFEARYAEIVQTALEAIISFGEDRVVTLFNAAAERIFRCPASEAVGRPVTRWFPELDFAAILREDRVHPPEPGRASSAAREATARRADGEEFPIEFSLSTLADEDGPAHTIIARDVSARRAAEEALRAQTESLAATTEELRVLNEELNRRTAELERAMGARSRFYASMSHELRTPINAILGYSSLLLDGIYGELSDAQVMSLERTHKAANHLLELVNDILDLSKIEAGKMELQLEAVPFPELLQDLFTTVAPLAEQHEVSLSLEGTDAPITIVSDPRRVRQILLNLLSNAIKFGREKPVRVSWARTGDGGVSVEVADEGPGIPDEEQERIFDEFVQLEVPREGPEGTGLGLPISRRLAEMLGGSLDVQSRPGQGSTFRLELPASDLDAPDAGSQQGVLAGT